jgi:ABC-2 type transport system permease protein
MKQTLIGFIKKELIQSLRDPRMKIMLFVMPVIQLCVFGFAISTEITNVKIAAQFDDKDYVLRDVYERCLASNWFIPAKGDTQDPYALVSSGLADVALVAPPGGFTHALGRGDAKLQVLINSTNVIKGQTIDSYIRSIVNTTVAQDFNIEFAKNPIAIEQRVLFNPDLNTAMFLVPGTMCMIMLITTMVLATLAIVREKEMGTFEMLISAPVTAWEIIYGKTVPYIILGMSNFPLILAVAYFVFDVPVRGSFVMLFSATFIFICMAVAAGLFLSTLCKNQQQATLASFIIIFPMVMMSGLMFPIENMPLLLKWFAYLDPLYHYIGLLRNILLKGGGMGYFITHILMLCCLAMITMYVSLKRFHTTIG